jgi:hypothetical protein
MRVESAVVQRLIGQLAGTTALDTATSHRALRSRVSEDGTRQRSMVMWQA